MNHKSNFKSGIWVVFAVSLIFVTNLTATPQRQGEQLRFLLPDVFGREVRSQDYLGVPLFLEFGACW